MRCKLTRPGSKQRTGVPLWSSRSSSIPPMSRPRRQQVMPSSSRPSHHLVLLLHIVVNIISPSPSSSFFYLFFSSSSFVVVLLLLVLVLSSGFFLPHFLLFLFCFLFLVFLFLYSLFISPSESPAAAEQSEVTANLGICKLRRNCPSERSPFSSNQSSTATGAALSQVAEQCIAMEVYLRVDWCWEASPSTRGSGKQCIADVRFALRTASTVGRVSAIALRSKGGQRLSRHKNFL